MSETTKNFLLRARTELCNAIVSMKIITPEYKELNEMVAQIEEILNIH